jgi:hypothetical protein
MQNKISQMFVILLQMTLLMGAWGAAQAVTPMAAGGHGHSCAVSSSWA